MTLTMRTIESALKGRWLQKPRVDSARGASIDTRSITPGQIFFALRGSQVDGHAFVPAAAKAGAALGVVDRDDVEMSPEMGVLLVDDARRALAQLAGVHRASFTTTRVIGVTGSAGKTTTVRLIEAALASLRGSASPKSFNNDLGVPLTILNADPDADFLVCEVGTNAPGEIEVLSRLVRPDVAVITTVGRAHLEGFGSVEAIAREKASMASHVRAGGCVIAGADAPLLRQALAGAPHVRTVGHDASADVRIEHVDFDERNLSVRLADGFAFTAPLTGRHNAVNAALAICVARQMGVDDAEIARSIASAHAAAQRLSVEDLPGQVRLIDDAYNANPESTLAALDVLVELGAESRRRVAILGDMLELGDQAGPAHAEIASRAASLPIDLCAHVGPHSAAAAPGDAVTLPDPSDDTLAALSGLLRPGDAVLVKGSRGMRLERVCEAIRRRFAIAPAARADNREADARLPQ